MERNKLYQMNEEKEEKHFTHKHTHTKRERDIKMYTIYVCEWKRAHTRTHMNSDRSKQFEKKLTLHQMTQEELSD